MGKIPPLRAEPAVMPTETIVAIIDIGRIPEAQRSVSWQLKGLQRGDMSVALPPHILEFRA